jgi:hypothetical protein
VYPDEESWLGQATAIAQLMGRGLTVSVDF